ncbi:MULTISPECIES: TauD/TfdA family dioxygenase [Methylosinus]|uniref:TauD/TfdA family dioxygenase n=1 Tax=Methylosinus TaxID=425 RepID=UPI000E27294B|nr:MULTISPECIES: TauD/TfdA family dioxygenase [Methylosinus]
MGGGKEGARLKRSYPRQLSRRTRFRRNSGLEIERDVAALLSGRHAARIRDVLEQRGVVVLDGLHLDDAQQHAFTRTIGELLLSYQQRAE